MTDLVTLGLPVRAAPARLTPEAIAAAASALAIEAAALAAIIEVESRGSGFLPDGRPKILFEAHLFGKQTQHQWSDAFPQISARKWDKALYVGGAGEWLRLQIAAGLHRAAALSSASWGMFQILGSNYRACGFQTPEVFAAAMCAGEAEQLAAAGAFLKSSGIIPHIQAGEWAKVARIYNGPAYAANQYDTKLAAAYARAKARGA